MRKGVRIPEQYGSGAKGKVESTCKLCGGYLMSKWCQNPECAQYKKMFRASSETIFCEECDELLELRAITNPCPDCLNNPTRLELEALKGELENQTDASFSLTVDAGEKYGKHWKGYSIEYSGVKAGRFSELIIPRELEDIQHLLPYSIEDVQAAPWLLLPFACLNVPQDSDLIVKVIRVRARYKDSPLFAEMRFPPFGRPITSIRGVENRHTQKDREKVQRALDLLGIVAEKDSPKGRPRDLQGETLSSIAQTYAHLWFCYEYGEIRDSRGRSKKPGLEELSGLYLVERTTLYRHITQTLKGSWGGRDGVKAEGIKNAQGLTIESIPAYLKSRFNIKG